MKDRAASRRLFALLRVDRLEHLGCQLDLGAKRHRKYIAVEVDGTPLVFFLGEHFANSFRRLQALVANHQLYFIR